MYGHPEESGNQFVWVLDDEPEPATEMDKELWRRYVELRSDLETTLEGLGMIRNWLAAKLAEVKFDKDDVVTIFGWEMKNAISHIEVTSNQLRALPGKHLGH
ncbi:MAG TPA: hypothetical protein VMZ92_18320 [Planctomycetota bacterium]|nr:hypothetical protein [Planctomycetota bacterium]